MSNDNNPLRTPLRWAGSKRSSLDVLLRYFPALTNRYIEPFCGSAALFFQLKPQEAVLSDINKSLVEFLKALKVAPEQVYDRATSYPRTEVAYYRLRERFNSECEPIQRAALFYYLNKNCFNGLYRTSRLGKFNVPFSPSRTGDYIAKSRFIAAAHLLKRAKIVCCDFEAAVRKFSKSGDIVFLDPPYSDAKRYPFREYYPECFAASDIDRLKDLLAFIEQKGAYFILTFSNRLSFELGNRRWAKRTIRTRRNISGFAEARKYADDLIITNLAAHK